MLLHESLVPSADHGYVLAVPPFAEEMNKSRRLLHDLAVELASRGVSMVVPDLYGTGDSMGDFSQADWETWKHDLGLAKKWSEARGRLVESMVCVRLGCALGAAAAADLGWTMKKTVWWQPVVDGKRFLTQFLRTRVAASMMSAGKPETADDLRKLLAQGETLEVSGYQLSSVLAGQVDRVQLDACLGPALGSVRWMEMARGSEPSISEAAVKAFEQMRARYPLLSQEAVGADYFWLAGELVRAPQLITATAEFLVEAT